jgi:DNA polymerase-3 subunit delta
MARAKTTPATQIHAVVGSDEAEVKRVARELAQQLGPGGDFGSDVIDGQADNADQAAERVHETIEALLTFPFFGTEKMVWLKNATFLADSPSGRASTVIEALEKLVAILSGGIPENTRFLLSAIDVDKRRSFYKALQKLATLQVFDKLDTSRSGWEEEAARLVRDVAEERALDFDPEALELFTLVTGGERRAIENEIEKLDLYLGRASRQVTAADVRLLVPLSRAGIVFELGNALARRDLHRSLALLDQLMFQGETAVGILLVTIIPTVRNLLLARDLMGRHKLGRPAQPFAFGKTLERLPADATAHLPRKKDGTVNTYGLGIAAMDAHRYSAKELRIALEACLEANLQLVTSVLEPKIILGQLLVRIIATP